MKPKTLKLINNISDLISEPSLLKPLSHSALIPGNCREIARTPGETNKQKKYIQRTTKHGTEQEITKSTQNRNHDINPNLCRDLRR